MAAEFYFNSGGVKKAKSIYYNDNGAIRKAKEIWYNDNGRMRKVFQALYPSFTTSFTTGGKHFVSLKNFLYGYIPKVTGSLGRPSFNIVKVSGNLETTIRIERLGYYSTKGSGFKPRRHYIYMTFTVTKGNSANLPNFITFRFNNKRNNSSSSIDLPKLSSTAYRVEAKSGAGQAVRDYLIKTGLDSPNKISVSLPNGYYFSD
ncbi:hypothetical protein VME_45700 [Vibrio harveyi 1DA3]|nr:hypothetical protein VME_45700 [Vibrio harveyi 1DA3]